MKERRVRSREDIMDALHMLRVESGLNQQDVAGALHTKQQYISRWEGANPAVLPRVETLTKLFDFFGHELVIRQKQT